MKKTILFFALLSLVTVGLICRSIEGKSLKNDHIIVCAKILSISMGHIGPIIDYEYYLMGKRYKFTGEGCTFETKREYESGNKYLLVVVKKTNFSSSRLLETSKDFLNYKVTIADTTGVRCDGRGSVSD